MVRVSAILLLVGLGACSAQSARFRSPVDQRREPYCQAVPQVCRMSSFVPSNEDAKSIVATEWSAARRRRHRIRRQPVAKVVPPAAVERRAEPMEPPKLIRTVSFPVEPEPDDPLLTSYWPALEAPAEAIAPASHSVAAIIRNPAAGAAIEPWEHSLTGKVVILGAVGVFWVAFAGFLAWPALQQWRMKHAIRSLHGASARIGG